MHSSALAFFLPLLPPSSGDAALRCINIFFPLPCTLLFFSQQLEELVRGDKMRAGRTQPSSVSSGAQQIALCLALGANTDLSIDLSDTSGFLDAAGYSAVVDRGRLCQQLGTFRPRQPGHCPSETSALGTTWCKSCDIPFKAMVGEAWVGGCWHHPSLGDFPPR